MSDSSLTQHSGKPQPSQGSSSHYGLSLPLEESGSGWHPVTAEQKTVISKRPLGENAQKAASAASLEISESLVGEFFGPIKLLEFVGGGGMGAVFRGLDTNLNRIVAVKVLSRDKTDADSLRRFQNEAQSAARLDHQYIARVHSVGEERGWNYIVFEFIEGTNIRDLVHKAGRLSLEEALRYTMQIAQALEHAQQRDVVHRDIKPSNILVTPAGDAKLVDMGLARLHQVETNEDLTASGVTLGTFDYISPEQARDPRSADIRSDIYSLGCTLYFMLTGHPLFPDGTVLQKLLKHSSDAPPDPRESRPELPEAITPLLAKMLAKLPSQRFQNPSELLKALALFADQLGYRGSWRGRTQQRPASSARAWLEQLLPAATILTAFLIMLVGLELWFPEQAQLSAPPPPQLGTAQPVEIPAPPEPPPAEFPPVQLPPAEPSESPKETEEVPADVPLGTVTSVSSTPTSSQSTGGEPASENPLHVAEIPAPISIDDSDPILQLAPAATPAETVIAPPSLIIVGSGENGPGVRIAATLAEALELANRWPQVETIELRFNGSQSVAPFEIQRKLVLKAGRGFAPVLTHRPALPALPGSFIALTAGELTLEGIDILQELPADAAAGWSLFELGPRVDLVAHYCRFTVVAESISGGPAFISVAPFAAMDVSQPLAPPTVHFYACIARGNATLVKAENVRPFRLDWEQGLLVTSQRLLETGGAKVRPQWDPLVEIDLQHVTAVMDAGMCLVSSNEAAPHYLALDIECSDSIFVTGSDSPLVEHRCAAEILSAPVAFVGNRNFYPASNVAWRKTSASEATVEHGFDARGPAWFHEETPRRSVMWNGLPTQELPLHRRGAENYLVSTHPGNPAARSAQGHASAGFDPEILSKWNAGEVMPGP